MLGLACGPPGTGPLV